MTIRDTLERLLWTVVSAFTGLMVVSGVLDISALDAAVGAAATAGLNFISLVARARLAVLPSPGEGLPGFLRGGRDSGRISLLDVVLVLAAVALVVWLLNNLGGPRG